MRFLIAIILAGALFIGGVPALAAPPWGYPQGLCNAPDPRVHPGHPIRTHLPFVTIDCSGGGGDQPDE
jgi:hypothetical protein